MHPLLALSLLTFAQPQSPEQLFRAMETRITTAKTLKLSCKSSFEIGTETGRVDVKLWAAAGNRLRVEAVDGLRPQKEAKVIIVSNGQKIGISLSPKADTEVRDTAVDCNQKVLKLLVRSAVATALRELLEPDSQPKPGEIELSKFKLGAAEKFDGKRQPQLIEYVLTPNSLTEKSTIKVKLGIDTETLLPVRRVITVVSGTSEATRIEVFSEFTLDPVIEDKLFELPQKERDP